jgi:hypothetical protein
LFYKFPVVKKINTYGIFHLAYIGHPAMKKMGAKQAYSIINGLAFLPLCFFGMNALLLSVIAAVSVNPIIVKNSSKKKFFFFKKNSLDIYWSCHMC